MLLFVLFILLSQYPFTCVEQSFPMTTPVLSILPFVAFPLFHAFELTLEDAYAPLPPHAPNPPLTCPLILVRLSLLLLPFAFVSRLLVQVIFIAVTLALRWFSAVEPPWGLSNQIVDSSHDLFAVGACKILIACVLQSVRCSAGLSVRWGCLAACL